VCKKKKKKKKKMNYFIIPEVLWVAILVAVEVAQGVMASLAFEPPSSLHTA
jgi:hypothetical protein